MFISLSLSLFISVCRPVYLSFLSLSECHCFKCSEKHTDARVVLSPRSIHSTQRFVRANSPVIELVSRIRTCPFYSGFFEYNVRVNYCRRVSQAHRSVHYGGGVWNCRNRERRTTGGHHCVHCRAPAHHLLHHRFLLAAQA